MANIVITTSGGGMYVDFGVYESGDLPSPQGFAKNTIQHIEPSGNGIIVKTHGRDTQTWPVCYGSVSGFMTIDTIDGVAPTSSDDLILLLTGLM